MGVRWATGYHALRYWLHLKCGRYRRNVRAQPAWGRPLGDVFVVGNSCARDREEKHRQTDTVTERLVTRV
jgi:hypothetical protein